MVLQVTVYTYHPDTSSILCSGNKSLFVFKFVLSLNETRTNCIIYCICTLSYSMSKELYYLTDKVFYIYYNEEVKKVIISVNKSKITYTVGDSQ